MHETEDNGKNSLEHSPTGESSENESLPSKQKHRKFEISSSLKEKLKHLPEALDYIKILEKHIKKQKSKLKRIKAKLKKKIKTKNVSVQTSHEATTNGVCAQSDPKSFADEIKEAAEMATQNTGFVYDENTGMYYDSNTGYYYNSEYGLYFDATSGTYLTYKQDTNTYEFHSRVYTEGQTKSTRVKQAKDVIKRKERIKDEPKAPKRARFADTSNETEEGECSTESDSYFSDTNSDSSDIVKQWPPCMRLIVEQSKSSKIKIGSLHILTYDGGTLGREGATNAILLPDINISKCHLKFTFNSDTYQYFAIDLGSRNGTILNGKRMAASKQESEPFEIQHGSRIQVGGVVLLCHVHDGSKTCGLCEPGLVQVDDKKIEVILPKSHRSELKKLKKKFGVSGFEDGAGKLAEGYTDRAQVRRETVGSQNPHEKTEVASLEQAIPAQNKGFKMLAKMGWKEGDALGREGQGIAEPVALVSNPGTSGMGSGGYVPANVGNKQIVWKKTQERFQLLPANNVFEESDD